MTELNSEPIYDDWGVDGITLLRLISNDINNVIAIFSNFLSIRHHIPVLEQTYPSFPDSILKLSNELLLYEKIFTEQMDDCMIRHVENIVRIISVFRDNIRNLQPDKANYNFIIDLVNRAHDRLVTIQTNLNYEKRNCHILWQFQYYGGNHSTRPNTIIVSAKTTAEATYMVYKSGIWHSHSEFTCIGIDNSPEARSYIVNTIL